jgi:hypothetical protein
VSTRNVADKTDTLKVDMQIPVVQGMEDEKYQGVLNDTLYETAMKDLDSLKRQEQTDAAQDAKDGATRMMPYEIAVRYTLEAAGGEADAGMLSLQVVTYVYTGGAHGMSRVDTYNVWNEPEARQITLENLFGADYKDLIDKHISGEIAKQQMGMFFKDAFKGIDDTRTFYIEKGDAVIVFGEYEIAAYAAGNPKFRIPIRLPSQLVVNGNKLSLQNASAYTDEAGMTMVPLRAAAEGLGYAVTWNEAQRAVEVSKGAWSTVVKVGKDEYAAEDRTAAAAVSLGAAPVIQPDGSMYVPLKFFTDIVKVQTSADAGVVNVKSVS